MRVSTWGYGFSFVVHAGAVAGIASLPEPARTAQAATTIVQATVQALPKPAPVEPSIVPEAVEAPAVEAPAPKPAPTPPPRRAATPAKAPPVEPRAASQPPPANPLPDFGLTMGGTVAAGGVAVPIGGEAPPTSRATRSNPAAVDTGRRTAAARAAANDGCTEEIVKPKPLGIVQPQYTDEAKAAGIEGRVRLQLTIDSVGNVLDASVSSGLGHGLDAAAVVAAKRMKFSPATRCNRAIEAPFGLSMRFVLGE